jgi:hypothetical protein
MWRSTADQAAAVANRAMVERAVSGYFDEDQTNRQAARIGYTRLREEGDEMHDMVGTAPGAAFRFERRP